MFFGDKEDNNDDVGGLGLDVSIVVDDVATFNGRFLRGEVFVPSISVFVIWTILFLESFLLLIKHKSKLRSVKISSFGSFSSKKTPKRLGRNPKTKDSYIIPELNKFNFKPSNKIKENLN